MADSLTSERRSWNMSRIRGRDTEPEVKLRSLLHRAGYRFRLHGRKLPGRPDIVLPRYRTTIFVHGCFWHRHEGCSNATTPSTRPEFWKVKFERNVARDRANAERLSDLGWRVIVVWECDLKKDPGGVLSSINRSLCGDH
ncbi:very short patch repair endonuclease [Methylosinus sp. LW3]|uniref:very short patch repair endonuclease n=1 Tax=Methylosinus sp. LW3 TaxID=107635 RepID=UPI000466BCD7|nr:very short patch repair endonuclease [Methylosinus sp. LW3]